MDNDKIVGSGIGREAFRVVLLYERTGIGNKFDLVAAPDGIVGIYERDDRGGSGHDDSERDDGTEVEDHAKHPGAVLVDLQSFDVVVSHADTEG